MEIDISACHGLRPCLCVAFSGRFRTREVIILIKGDNCGSVGFGLGIGTTWSKFSECTLLLVMKMIAATISNVLTPENPLWLQKTNFQSQWTFGVKRSLMQTETFSVSQPKNTKGYILPTKYNGEEKRPDQHYSPSTLK